MTTFSPELSPPNHDLFKIRGRMIPYDEFSDRLKILSASLGLGPVTSCTSDFPITCFSAGAGIEQVRSGEGENAVYVLSTKVSYNPSWGGSLRLPRLLKSKQKSRPSCVPADFIAPFLHLYRLAQENIFLSRTLQGQCLISLHETLWEGYWGGSHYTLNFHLDRIVKPAQDGTPRPVMISGNLTSYEVTADFQRTVADLVNDWSCGRKVSIGRYLSCELFSYTVDDGEIKSDNPYIETIMPCINEIITHPTPNLRAAEIHLQQIFVRDTERLAAECRMNPRNLLCIAGLDIDMTAFTGKEEHYFVPWQAYVTFSGKTSVEEYSLAQDDLFVQLMQQNVC